MEKDVFIKIIYVVFALTLLVNIYLGIDIYFEFKQPLISGKYFGKVFIFLNALLFFSFIVYPIYGNKKFGTERVKIKPLVLAWIFEFVVLIFLALKFVLQGVL